MRWSLSWRTLKRTLIFPRRTSPRTPRINSWAASSEELLSWTNCCAPPTKDKSCAAVFVRPSSGGPTPANPVCSTNSLAATVPSSPPFPEPPEILLRKLLTPEDETYLAEFAAKKRILVRNKIDLPAWLELPPVPNARLMEVSCLTGQGIEALKDAIKELVWSGEIQAAMLEVMINSRHKDALERARAATLHTAEALRAGQTLELAAMDLRIAVNAVGEIVGKTTTEDLLDRIFSQFCIGK